MRVDASAAPSAAAAIRSGEVVATCDVSPATSTPLAAAQVPGGVPGGGTTRGAVASSSDSSHASDATSTKVPGFTGTIQTKPAAPP